MKLLANYFDLSKKEQRAMLLLAGLILVLQFIRISLPPPKLSREDSILLQKRRAQLQAQLNLNGRAADKDTCSVPKGKRAQAVELSFFDPNLANEGQLFELGFKEYQIKNIVNYRKSGGKFRQASDLKKLYSLKNADLQKYLPFVIISGVEEKKNRSVQAGWSEAPRLKPLVDLNTADSIQLLGLKGIGPYFVHKIMEYRYRLGGFVKASQLLEIFRFTPEMLREIENEILVKPTGVSPRNINKMSFDELKKHPYIGWKWAKAIVKYREQHGNFTAIKEISNSVLINDSLYSKIAPYLSVDD